MCILSDNNIHLWLWEIHSILLPQYRWLNRFWRNFLYIQNLESYHTFWKIHLCIFYNFFIVKKVYVICNDQICSTSKEQPGDSHIFRFYLFQVILWRFSYFRMSYCISLYPLCRWLDRTITFGNYTSNSKMDYIGPLSLSGTPPPRLIYVLTCCSGHIERCS